MINTDGRRLRKVVNSLGNDHGPPAWSPDGTQLLYIATGLENHNGELTSVDLMSLRTTQLTRNASFDLLPTWRG